MVALESRLLLSLEFNKRQSFVVIVALTVEQRLQVFFIRNTQVPVCTRKQIKPHFLVKPSATWLHFHQGESI